ncbi:RWD domain-containing protein 3 isoform 2-T2 [Pholidichthys leucotaenia]
MSEVAFEEVSVLSSIYCREGEFQLLRQSDQDGLVIQINCHGLGDGGPDVSLLFHLHPSYPSCPPDISVSSTGLSRSHCHGIRKKLLDLAAAMPPEPMVHRLVELVQQCLQVTEDCSGGEEEVKETETEQQWTTVLMIDHMRSRNRYIGLVERWTHQLQLTGMLLLGQSVLVILQGARAHIKEFCRRLKTVKVDVDSSGKKCKEKMMKVVSETPVPTSCRHSLQGFIVKDYKSSSELNEALQELSMAELYREIMTSVS